MTVASTSRLAGPFAGNGVLTSYPFTFKVFAKADLKVYLTDTVGTESVGLLDSDYLVTLNPNQDSSPGGSLQYAAGGVARALPSGWTLTITGEGIDFTQDADLPQGGSYNPLTVENALDRLNMIALTLRDQQRRTLTLPASAADADATLPVPEANLLLGWNPTGDGLRNVDPAALVPVADVGWELVSEFPSVADAVAYAYANGRWLFWDESKTTTVSIPNLHDVRHLGPGTLTRGADVWTFSPIETTTLTLYVSQAGSDTNDGLTATFPLATLQRAYNIIRDRAPLTGRYTIRLAAGTYTENVAVSSMTESDFPIDVRGPSVGGHPNVPTAIISAATVSGDILDFNQGGWFRFFDVRLTGATTGNAVTATRTRLSLTNVHIDACLRGVTVEHGGFVGAFGGIWTGRGKAVSGGFGFRSYYGSTHSIEVTASADALLIEDFETGMLISEGAQGHLDYTRVHDCGTGMLITRGAGGCNTDAMEFLRNDVAIDAREHWYNNNIVFGTGGDANTVNVRCSGNAAEYDYRNVDFVSKTRRLQQSSYGVTHTGTTSPTQIAEYSLIRPWMISEGGDSVEVVLALTCSASAGTVGVSLFLWDGTTEDFLEGITLPIGTTKAMVRGTVAFSAVGAQRCMIQAVHNAGTLLSDYGTGALNFKNLAGTLRIKCTLSNSADSIAFRFIEVHSTLGG